MSRRRKIGLAVVLGLALLLALDWLQPPEDQLTTATLLMAIDGYQATGSPLFRRLGVRCRFEPTCSRYAEAVIRRDGALVGSLRAAGRLLRCNPWTAPGQLDPP